MPLTADQSNKNAQRRWNAKAVGSQRASSEKGSREYFAEIKQYRYGYETPFIPTLLLANVKDKDVLEIGVGNGIDAGEIVSGGARYTGLDIAKNHLELTEKYLCQNNLSYDQLIEGDLLQTPPGKKFDVIYSFGVLHHIAHEEQYLAKIRDLLKPEGELRIGVYSKYSFFNAYLFFTWLVKNRCRQSFNRWQGYVSDDADFEHPITIKIRSKKDVFSLYEKCGFRVEKYCKRGFVQNNLPIIGRAFAPDGILLRFLGSLLGWYHIVTFKKHVIDRRIEFKPGKELTLL